jgi:hypothetical protein
MTGTAKQSISPRKGRMDCFVARAPRNDVVRSRFTFQTADARPPSRDMICPSFAQTFSLVEGAGNAGCALHPRSRVQDAQRNAHTSIQVQRKHSRLPCAMVLRLTSRSSATGLCCHRRLAGLTARLDASVRASGPHDFAVRLSAVRQRHIRVHGIPPRVRDDREPPLSSGETGGFKPLICPTAKAEYFC